MFRKSPYAALAAMAFISLVATGALAQEQAAKADAAAFRLELNGMANEGDACRLTFVATNQLGAALEASGFEMVLFDGQGLVSRMTVFDFGAMADGKMLVKRFDVPAVACGDLSRVLVNGAARCQGEGIDSQACGDALVTTNKTDLGFGL